MKKFHKKLVKDFQKKYGVSDYELLWIFFLEGFITGGIIVYIII